MKIFITILLVIFSNLILQAQELDYQIEKPQKVYIGTPIKIHIEITAEPGDSIYSQAADSLDVFLLQKEVLQSEEIIDQQKKISQTLIYQPFHTGEYAFPQLEFAVKTASGMKFLKTSEFQVNVLSAVPDSAQSIKDITDPVKVNLGFWDYLIPIAVIVLLVLLLKYLIRFFRKIKQTEEKGAVTDNRPSWEVALNMLKQLSDTDLLEKGDFLNYYFQLSLILRYFLELEYKIKAVEMTTSEIRAQLKLPHHGEKSEILDFLSRADRIKFARQATDIDHSRKAYDWLYNYLLIYKMRSENQITAAEDDNAGIR
jgi:hypothetical protein